MNSQKNTCFDHVIHEPNCSRCESSSIKHEIEQIWLNLDATNRLVSLSSDKADEYADTVNDAFGHQRASYEGAITLLQDRYDRLNVQYLALVHRVDHMTNALKLEASWKDANDKFRCRACNKDKLMIALHSYGICSSCFTLKATENKKTRSTRYIVPTIEWSLSATDKNFVCVKCKSLKVDPYSDLCPSCTDPIK